MSTGAISAGDGTAWADAHNHLQDSRLAGHTDLAPPCISNSTCEGDWADALCAATPNGRHAALGIHPWFVETVENGWQNRLTEILKMHPAATIGECGLDSKCTTSKIESQIPVLEFQLRLARNLNRPITIHCVGAWAHLLDILKREPPPTKWLIHSFQGSPETARQLTGMGAFLSISGSALHPNGVKSLKAFRNIAPTQILLETDAPNQAPPADIVTHPLPGKLNHPSNLAAIGSAIAPHLGFTPADFANLTRRNFDRFLGMDSE